MNLNELKAKNRTPGRTLVIPLWAFADDWGRRPEAAICVGLRLVSEGDKGRARVEAEKYATEAHPTDPNNWVDAFNDTIVRYVVAAGMCDPNKVDSPHELFPYPEADIMMAFTSKGALFVYESLCRYELEVSPIGIPAETAEVERLVKALPMARLEAMPLTLRRLITHVLDQVEEFVPAEARAAS